MKCPFCGEELYEDDEVIELKKIRNMRTGKPMLIHHDCSYQTCLQCQKEIDLLNDEFKLIPSEEETLQCLCEDCAKEADGALKQAKENGELPEDMDETGLPNQLDLENITDEQIAELPQEYQDQIKAMQSALNELKELKRIASFYELNEKFYGSHFEDDSNADLLDENGNLIQPMKQPEFQKINNYLKAKIENYAFQYTNDGNELTESDHKEVLNLIWDLIKLTVDALAATKGHESEYLEYFQTMKKYIESLSNDLIKYLYKECGGQNLEIEEIKYFAFLQKNLKVLINGIFVFRFDKYLCRANFEHFKKLFYDLFE